MNISVFLDHNISLSERKKSIVLLRFFVHFLDFQTRHAYSIVSENCCYRLIFDYSHAIYCPNPSLIIVFYQRKALVVTNLYVGVMLLTHLAEFSASEDFMWIWIISMHYPNFFSVQFVCLLGTQYEHKVSLMRRAIKHQTQSHSPFLLQMKRSVYIKLWMNRVTKYYLYIRHFIGPIKYRLRTRLSFFFLFFFLLRNNYWRWIRWRVDHELLPRVCRKTEGNIVTRFAAWRRPTFRRIPENEAKLIMHRHKHIA